MSSLDVSKCANLKELSCHDNQLSSLDVSKCANLKELYCHNNQLSSLNIRELAVLEKIWLYGNSFSTSTLNSIYCQLPDRNGKSDKGRIYVHAWRGNEVDKLLAESTCEAIADAKNWRIEDVGKISGNHTCGITYALTLAPATLPNSFSYQGDEWKTTVTSTSNWKIDESTLPDWLSVEPKQGNSGTQVTIRATPNTEAAERSTALTFVLTNDITTKQVVILRQKSELLVTRSNSFSSTLSAIGGKYIRLFAVTSSGDWEVTSSDAWCSVTPQSGNAGFMRLTLKVDANNAKDARQATLTFTLKNKPEIKQEVTEKQDGAYIHVYPSKSYTFPAEGETKEKYFTVESTGEWEATSSSAWCSVVPQTGDDDAKVTVKAEPNNSKDLRKATLTFSLKANAEIKQEVTLEQGGASISISPSEGYTFPAAGETKSDFFTVTSTDVWEVTSSSAWCSVRPQSGSAGETKVTIEAEANSNENERQAVLTFALKSNTEIKKVVTLQQAKAISVIPSEGYTFLAAGETKENFFTVISAKAWEVTSSNLEWFPVVEKEGNSGTTQVTIKTDANRSTAERKTELTFALKSNTAIKQVITVKQLGKQAEVIAVTPTEGYTFPAAGETKENYFMVRSSGAWTVTSSNAEWFPVETKEGEAGTTKVTIKAEANSNDTERQTTLTFALKSNAAVKQTVVLKQEPKPTIKVTPSEGYTFLAAGETKTDYFTVESTGEWTISGYHSSWCTVTPESGEAGSHKVTISATENTGGARSTTLIFALKNNTEVEQEIVVEQKAASIKVTPIDGYTFAAGGGTKTDYITVESTGEWTVSGYDGSWCTVTPESGEAGSHKVTIQASKNEGAERSTTLTFALRNNAEIKQVITIKQFAKGAAAIAVSPSYDYTFPASGETLSDYFTVESTDEWTVSGYDGSWCTVTPESGEVGTHTVTISASKNEGAERSTTLTFALKENTEIKQVVTLSQAAKQMPTIYVSPSYGYTFSAGAETKADYFAVESTGEWTVFGYDNSWCTVTPESGEAGLHKVTIQASKNEGVARSTTLTFALKENTEIKQVVTLKQHPKKTPEPNPNPSAVEGAQFSNVMVSPNPFGDELRIKNEELRGEYTLLNANGVVLQSGALENGETNIKTTTLPSGIYLLQLTANGGASKTYRVIKQ